MAQPDEMERILESGISSYRKAEPLAGLEERVIGRIGSAEMPRRSGIAWLGVLALGLAGMVAAGLVLIPMKRSEPRRRAAAVMAPVRPVEGAPLRVSEPRRQLRVAHARRVRSLPKGPVFPTPSSLTEEERLLALMVADNPDGVAQAFESLRRQVEEPVAVAPIVIPMISAGEGQ